MASLVDKSTTGKKPKKVTVAETQAAPADPAKPPALNLASILGPIKK